MNDDMQVRVAADTWPDSEAVTIRAEAEGDGFTFTGYAAVFDTPSEPLPFRETIAPGAFRTSLNARRDIRMFLNHNWDVVLASRKAKTMTLQEDDTGLYVRATLPDNEWGRPVRDAVQRGDISGMSFGFQPVKQDPPNPRIDEDRTVVEARLFEVSPVTAWPAYSATSADVRMLADLIDVEETELQTSLRALTSDEMLTEAQRDILERAISARTPRPLGTPLRDQWADRLAAL
jgi:HK97 family phage prohead protease